MSEQPASGVARRLRDFYHGVAASDTARSDAFRERMETEGNGCLTSRAR